MKVIHNASTREMRVQHTGSADIQMGELVMPGTTAETDDSVFIRATGAAADALGVVLELGDISENDNDPELGTDYGTIAVDPILPGDLVAAEMGDNTDNDLAVTSYTGSTITITDLEDNIDGAWVYVRGGTGVGQLGYIITSAAGSFVLKDTLPTNPDNTSLLVIMRPVGHQLLTLSVTTRPSQEIGSATAAAGSLPWRVLRNEIKDPDSSGWRPLDYTRDHDRTGLNVTGFRLRQILVPANTFFNPTD